MYKGLLLFFTRSCLPADKNPLGFDGQSFDERSRQSRLVEKDDIHGPTTTIQGRCALATDTPSPMVAMILRCTHPASNRRTRKNKRTSTELLDVNESFKLNLQ
jgi:hypothetical protein